jgi:RHS repeat-associated protein
MLHPLQQGKNKTDMSAALAYLDDEQTLPRRARHLYLVAVDGRIVDSGNPNKNPSDVLDRTLQTKLPDGTITSIAYGFGPDRNRVNQFKTTVTDANGKIKESYRDVRELITSVKETNNKVDIWTSYTYDPLKQIVEVKDAKGNLTRATYDNLGRRTSLSNPDTGTTQTVYDTASNVVTKITANLAAAGATATGAGQAKAINYVYDYNRLTAIHYPNSIGNNVTYTYGAASLSNNLNQIGRIVRVTDASGFEERAYGKLGETVNEIRTIASHTQGNSANSPEVYTTQYHYDTFGRILTLTLPDTEIITYGYDAGGNLATFAGDKKGEHTPYLQSLLYDKFEQRTYLKLGNGIETNYTYKDTNRRLINLMSQGSVAGKFQNLGYAYDNVGNILGLKNDTAIPAPSGMGGPTNMTYGYDDLYRLTSASGKFQSSPDKTRNYTLAMGFDDIHNIVSKTQADNLTNAGGTVIPQKATSYDWSYAYGGTQPHAPTHIGTHTFSYDADGNQLGWSDDKNGTRRIMLWDEDNRISEIDDNGQRSKYTYDDKDERVIKVARQGETVYVNQYYVVRNRSIVSKHLYAGTSRLVTRMVMGTAPGNNFHGSGSNPTAGSSQGGSTGGGQSSVPGQDKQNPGQGDAHRNTDNSQAAAHGKGGKGANAHDAGDSSGEGASNLPGNSEAGLENALANGQGNKYGIYKHLAKEGDTVDASGEIVASGTAGSGTGNQVAASGQSDFTYYYHPDHLGSTGYVTDANGKLYEHLEYFPFGETWVQEHSNTLRTPYLFTGKEFDQETGLYYFGARYYDPRTSVWQSADAILGKYLPSGGSADPSKLAGMGGVYNTANLGMFSYAHNNPMKFTDPDGNESIFLFVAAMEYNRDSPTGGAYFAVNIHDQGSGPGGLGINIQVGKNWVTRGVNKTDPSHNVAGGGQVAIKGGIYPFGVVDKGVDRNGRGKGLVPKLLGGAAIPTLSPNAAHQGNSVADGELLHSMNKNGKANDSNHGGSTYFGSEGCNGPADGIKPMGFMEGSEAGDKGSYMLMRPSEAVGKVVGWFKSLGD